MPHDLEVQQKQLLSKALNFLDHGDFTESFNTLFELIKIDINNAKNIQIFFTIYLKLPAGSKKKVALNTINILHASSLAKTDANYVFACSEIYFDAEKYDLFIDIAKDFLEHNPNSSKEALIEMKLTDALYMNGNLIDAFDAAENFYHKYNGKETNFLLFIIRLGTQLPFKEYELKKYFQKALQITDIVPRFFRSFLISLYFEDKANLAEIQLQTKSLVEKIFTKSSFKTKKQIYKADLKKLNIAFVSGDFRIHPVGIIFSDLLSNLNKELFSVHILSNSDSCDELSEIIKSNVTSFTTISNKSDADLCKLIQKKDIDILIDLSGITEGARLSLFRSCSSILRISWLGYWGTVSEEYFDYILADKYVVEQSEFKFFSEKIFQMPNLYLPIEQKYKYINITDAPCHKNKYITFGCGQRVQKLTNSIIETWVEILDRVPNSRLLFTGYGLNDSKCCELIKNKFIDAGIDAERINFFVPTLIREKYLEFFNQVDIILDTYPFGAGSTALEALNMSTPIITCHGDRWCSRITAGIYSILSIEDLVAYNFDEYKNKAVSLANNYEQIQYYKKNLKALIQDSAGNLNTFTKDFENSILKIYKDHYETTEVSCELQKTK